MQQKPENIDHYFRNALEKFEAMPDESVWDNIAKRLVQKKKKTAVFYMTRIAATIALVSALGIILYYITSHSGKNKPVIESLAETTREFKAQESLTETKAIENLTDIESGTGMLHNPVSDTEILAIELSPDPEHVVEGKTEVTSMPAVPVKDDQKLDMKTTLTKITGLEDVSIPVIHLAGILKSGYHDQQMIQQTTMIVSDEFFVSEIPGNIDDRQWHVGGEFAPVYTYRHISSDKLNNQQINDLNDAESGLLAYAGGISVSYSPARRFSIQSGLYYSKYGQEKEKISVYSADNRSEDFVTLDISNVGRVAITNSTGVIASSSDPENQLEHLVISFGSGYYNNLNDITAIQYFDFLEIPLIFKYKIIDRKIDFRMLGGMVTNLMIGNRVYLKQDNDYTYYGKTEDIHVINYIGMIGLGLEYPFSVRLAINVEPRFRYYLNSIDKTVGLNVHPYSFGIFTGISYSF